MPHTQCPLLSSSTNSGQHCLIISTMPNVEGPAVATCGDGCTSVNRYVRPTAQQASMAKRNPCSHNRIRIHVVGCCPNPGWNTVRSHSQYTIYNASRVSACRGVVKASKADNTQGPEVKAGNGTQLPPLASTPTPKHTCHLLNDNSTGNSAEAALPRRHAYPTLLSQTPSTTAVHAKGTKPYALQTPYAHKAPLKGCFPSSSYQGCFHNAASCTPRHAGVTCHDTAGTGDSHNSAKRHGAISSAMLATSIGLMCCTMIHCCTKSEE